MKNILIITHRKVESAPRVIREINALKNDFNIFILGEEPTIKFADVHSSLFNLRTFKDKLINRLLIKLSRVTNTLFNLRFSKLPDFIVSNSIDVIIIHEPTYLKIAIDLQKKLKVKIIFNAHEYHPLEFEDNPVWKKTTGKHQTNLYKRYLAELDLLVNVSEGIRLKCLEEYNVDSIVIPNAAPYNKIQPTINTSAEIKLIHHGVILQSRHIEKMIEIVKELGGNYTLDIMGVKSPSEQNYYNKLVEMARTTNNVRFIDPVAFSEIIPFINSYDIGLYCLEPNSLNHVYALPNKFFEFIQAKLAIAISPSVEMVNIATKYGSAIIAADFSNESMVDALGTITREDINKMKSNSEIAAKVENAETYQALFLEKVLTLVNNDKG